MNRINAAVFSAASTLFLMAATHAGDWPQFRGPESHATTADSVPVQWSETENLRWKLELPGPGSSSPIVVGNRVFITCYSGYGDSSGSEDIKSLKRHLLCIDRANGEVLWTKTIDGESPEDEYRGYISEHGYASSTPVADDERVFCFFGKSGVFAFDLEGNQIWSVNVGKESSNRQWGSAASLILYKDAVIVNASEESRSVRALDKTSGKELWKAEGAALELAYGTPSLVQRTDDRIDLVIAVPEELWGINPDSGKIAWYATHQLTGNICPSVVTDGDRMYVFGGYRSAGSLAVRAGGSGDVTETHVLWTSRQSSYVATPLLHEGRMYWISDNGFAFCIAADTGKLVYRERIPEINWSGRPVYASPVIADARIYVPTRHDGVLVYSVGPEFHLIANNKFEGDYEFNGTVAISNHELFLRSNRFLYCVADISSNSK